MKLKWTVSNKNTSWVKKASSLALVNLIQILIADTRPAVNMLVVTPVVVLNYIITLTTDFIGRDILISDIDTFQT